MKGGDGDPVVSARGPLSDLSLGFSLIPSIPNSFSTVFNYISYTNLKKTRSIIKQFNQFINSVIFASFIII